jgi:hypothetical protein
MTIYVSCPPHVHSVNIGPAAVVLDTHSGQLETLLGHMHETWVDLARTGDVAITAAAVGGADGDTAELVRRLTSRGLLRRASRPRPWTVPQAAPTAPSWGTDEALSAIALRTPTPCMPTVLAGLALVGVVAVRSSGRRRRSFARVVRLVTGASMLARRMAEPAAAVRAITCVRNAASLLPFRIACLEESASAVLFLAMAGRRVEWHHGVAADPIRLHAWISVNGHAIAEPPSTARYTSLMHIPRICRQPDVGIEAASRIRRTPA